MDLSGVLGIVVLVLAVVLFIPLVFGAIFVVVVVANRADPDPTARRPVAVYAFAVAFVTLFVTLFATTGLIASLAQLIGDHSRSISSSQPIINFGGPSGKSLHPVGDAVARGSVLSIIVALVAGAIYFRHRHRGDDAAAGTAPVEPAARVQSSYVAAVSFVCVVLTVLGTIVVCYDVFRLIAPGVFAPGLNDGRETVLRSLLPAAWLAVLAQGIRRRHLDRWRARLATAAPLAPPVTE